MSRLPFSGAVALIVVILSVTGGCAWTQDERDFYGRGWLNPRDLDRPAPYRGTRPAGESPGSNLPANPWAVPAPIDVGRQ